MVIGLRSDGSTAFQAALCVLDSERVGGSDNNRFQSSHSCFMISDAQVLCRHEVIITACRELTIGATIRQLTGLTSLHVKKCFASGSIGFVGTLTQLRALYLSDSSIPSLQYISGDHHHLKFDQ